MPFPEICEGYDMATKPKDEEAQEPTPAPAKQKIKAPPGKLLLLDDGNGVPDGAALQKCDGSYVGSLDSSVIVLESPKDGGRYPEKAIRSLKLLIGAICVARDVKPHETLVCEVRGLSGPSLAQCAVEVIEKAKPRNNLDII